MINSVVSAYYYLRVVVVMYMRDSRRVGEAKAPVCLALQVGVGIAAVVIVLLGLWPGPILVLAQSTARALLGG